ncbi:hypothetical protein FB45DRAFT_907554 [Roridomyces roridus]|uniref:Potassium channel domain-containing protein n=1 Tax=Roridomyces roridus TaxID=1738132 RepID=A0AAD7FTB6_9AGAR|nr:hypothetical protein FB45DRAFT_907554 [Roridomyces roridus]
MTILRYLPLILFNRPIITNRHPDPEKGLDPNPPETDENSPSDDLEELDEDEEDLDHEHDTDDIINGMEVEEQLAEEPVAPAPPRHTRTDVSSLTAVMDDKESIPTWTSRVREILNPKTTNEELDNYTARYRWTPILSGIVIPFSILLEIPGLTEHWYVRTVDNKIVERRPNPAILNIGLGFSMACALAANICLVARFLEKKVKLMTVGCILFLTIHDLINIIAVTIFGVEHRFNDGFTYGQSFWVTVCSTAVSTFTNLTLIYDLVLTPDFEKSGSGLTRRQRSLIIVVILLLCYIALGSLIFSIILHLNFIDAMYFSLVTIETIGFGDITPPTTGARVFTCIYAAFGILMIALAVGLMRDTVLEGLEVGYRKRVQAMRQRRKIGRWKRRVSNRWREAIEWRLREKGAPVWVRNENRPVRDGLVGRVLHSLDGRIPSWTWLWHDGGGSDTVSHGSGTGFMMGHGLGYGNHPHGMHLNLEALSWKQLEAAAMEAGVPLNTLLPEGFGQRHNDESSSSSSHHAGHHGSVGMPIAPPEPGIPLTHARMGRMIGMIGSFALAVNESHLLHGGVRTSSGFPKPPPAPPQFKKSLTLQYDAFRASMEKEETKAFYARLIVVWALFITFWVVGPTGSVIFMQTEKWEFGRSFYFCFIAFTTIGYGDSSPQTPAGRSVFVAWALLGVATMTILISVIAEAFSSKYRNAIYAGVFDRAVKRYRERVRLLAEKARRGKKANAHNPPPLMEPHLAGPSTDDAVHKSHLKVQEQLEALPHKILADAKMFHEHLSYFVSKGKSMGVDSDDPLPPGLQKLMNEITSAERLGERVKREILQDDDARHTLFTLSIEQALRKMITSAEDALLALEEREQLVQMQQEALEEDDDDDEPEPSTVPGPSASQLAAHWRSAQPGESTATGAEYLRYDTGTSSEFQVSVQPRRTPTGVPYTRHDTATSSEYPVPMPGPSVLPASAVRRPTGIPYGRYDTTTSSEFSYWGRH